MSCTAYANPPANVTWLRLFKGNNATSTETEEDLGVQGVGKSSMVFPKLTKKDAGEYKCTATNKYGNTSKTASVFVKGFTGNISIHFCFFFYFQVFILVAVLDLDKMIHLAMFKKNIFFSEFQGIGRFKTYFNVF